MSETKPCDVLFLFCEKFIEFKDAGFVQINLSKTTNTLTLRSLIGESMRAEDDKES